MAGWEKRVRGWAFTPDHDRVGEPGGGVGREGAVVPEGRSLRAGDCVGSEAKGSIIMSRLPTLLLGISGRMSRQRVNLAESPY